MNSLGAKRRSNRHLKSNKRLRKFAIVTPWKDEFELEAVGRALLSVVESTIASESDEGYYQMPIEQAFEIVALTAHHQVTTVELVQKCARATTLMTEVQPQIAVRENRYRSACRLP